MAFIYKIVNDINNKVYIGKTVKTIKTRWQQHLTEEKKNKTKSEKRALYSAMNKYGVQHFKILQIEECEPEKASERECYWIKQYDSFHNGYNQTLGGDGRTTIDYNKVVELYNKYLNYQKVADIIGCQKDTIRVILHSKNVKALSQEDALRLKMGKKVICRDAKTDEIIKQFNNYRQAALWIQQQNKGGNSSLAAIQSGISHCVTKQYKTSRGYKWTSE